MRQSLILLVTGLALAGCQTTQERSALQVGTATIAGPGGRIAGAVRLFALDGEVTINVALRELPGQLHPVRLHAVGDCAAADFASAGAPIVFSGSAGDPGRLPDLRAAADGTGTMSAILPGDEAGVLARIFDADGTAVVVYAASGDTRLACGVLQPG